MVVRIDEIAWCAFFLQRMVQADAPPEAAPRDAISFEGVALETWSALQLHR
jgi:hypothetical protein